MLPARHQYQQKAAGSRLAVSKREVAGGGHQGSKTASRRQRAAGSRKHTVSSCLHLGRFEPA